MKPMHTNRNLYIAMAIALVLGLGSIGAALFLRPPPAPLPITVVQLQAPHSGLLQIAEAEGFFKQEGLDVNVKTAMTGHQAIAQVLDGVADIGTAAYTPFAQALAQGKKPKLIATIFSSRWSSGVVVRKDRGILHPTDLAGKRIGFVSGTNTHYDLETLLAFLGIPLESVTLVPGRPDELVSGMMSGNLDAASIWIPFLTQITQAMGEQVTTFYPKEGYAECFNIVVRQDYVATHPEEVARLLRALVKAENFALENPTQATAIIAAASGVDVSALVGRSAALAYELTLKQSLVIGTENQVRWIFRRGMVPDGPFPDVIGAIDTQPMRQIKPESVTISR